MKRYKVFVVPMYSGLDSEACILEFENNTSHADIEEACQDAIHDMIDNYVLSGWDEIDENAR